MSTTNEEHAVKWSIAVFICVFDILFISPIQYYLCRRYLNITQNNNAKLQKSHPDINKCLAVFAVIFTLIFHPQQAVTLISPLYYENPFCWQILTMVGNCILFGIVYGAGLSGIVRTWLMCFDLNLCHYQMNKCWKIYLNPHLMKNNFWFKSQNTFGNKEYIIKRAIILFIILFIANSIAVCYYNDMKYQIFWRIWTLFLYAMNGIYGICLYVLTPSIPDHNTIFLKYELKWTILISVIAVAVNAMITSLHFERMFLDKLDTFRQSLTVIVHGVSIFVYCMFHCYIMPRRYENKKYEAINIESVSGSTNENNEHLSLQELFTNNKHKDEMEKFIQFLCKEFELENFLCFVELYQFKYLLDYTFDISAKLDRERSTSMDFAESNRDIDDEYDYYSFNDIMNNQLIPKSHIVYNLKEHQTQQHFLEIAHRLYFKYIHQNDCNENKDVLSIINENEELKEYYYDWNGELTVNTISKTMRKCYGDDMNMSLSDYINKMELETNGIKVKDLFHIFDPIIQCTYHALAVSHAKHVTHV